ncbi:GtrA family protein [Nocardia brasiliensis]|uniref:GtrA family protein n=1 Tax=Nocardia brasiliensis TaxID=37326 RepID=UPI0022869F2B|nr:GtrA family protein [Nocardia brasiliensis]
MDFDDDRSVASARTEEVVRAVPRAPLRDADKYDLRADTANHQVPPASPAEADQGLAQQSGDAVQSSAEFAPEGETFRTAGGTGATAPDLGGYAAADSARIAVGDTDVSRGGPSAMGSEAVAGAGGEPVPDGVVAGAGLADGGRAAVTRAGGEVSAGAAAGVAGAGLADGGRAAVMRAGGEVSAGAAAGVAGAGLADGGRAAVTRAGGEVSAGAAAGAGVAGLADGGRGGATSAGGGALTGGGAAGAGGGVAAGVGDSAAGGVENPGPLLRVVRRQELAFAVVGGFNTALGIGMTVVWLAVLGDNVPPSVAVAAAYAVSIAVAFVLHRTLVFRVRGHLLRDFLRFVAVNSGGLLLNMVLLELAVSVWHFPDKPAAVVVMGLVAVASYFGHRHISFHRRPAVESRDVVG